MSGTPILSEEKPRRTTSKGLSVKNKNKMCSILGFILYLKENGKMDEIEAKNLMEELPLYSTARVQSEFFDNEIFDLKKVEVELWKPMVVENKLIKKNAKKNKNNKKNGLPSDEEGGVVVVVGEVEATKKQKPTKKPTKPKKVKETETETEVEAEAVEPVIDKEDNNKKRGRKAKKTIVKFNNVIVDDELENKPDQFEELLNDMLLDTNANANTSSDEEVVNVNENDLDKVLRELEMEDFGGEEDVVVTPATTPPSKKVSKKEKKEEPPQQVKVVKEKVVKEKVKKDKK
jgi:hypothetical protein